MVVVVVEIIKLHLVQPGRFLAAKGYVALGDMLFMIISRNLPIGSFLGSVVVDVSKGHQVRPHSVYKQRCFEFG